MVRTGLLGRRCGFNPSRRHTAVSSADSIDRIVGLGRVRIRQHLSASEGAPDPTDHDKPAAKCGRCPETAALTRIRSAGLLDARRGLLRHFPMVACFMNQNITLFAFQRLAAGDRKSRKTANQRESIREDSRDS